MTGSWYVLVEEDREVDGRVDGNTFSVNRWQLASTEHVEGDRAAAQVRAEELAQNYVPSDMVRYRPKGSRPHRLVFRTADGSLLVALKLWNDTRHLRVTIAELVHSEEEFVPPSEPQRKKGLFRR